MKACEVGPFQFQVLETWWMSAFGGLPIASCAGLSPHQGSGVVVYASSARQGSAAFSRRILAVFTMSLSMIFLGGYCGLLGTCLKLHWLAKAFISCGILRTVCHSWALLGCYVLRRRLWRHEWHWLKRWLSESGPPGSENSSQQPESMFYHWVQTSLRLDLHGLLLQEHCP